MQGADRLARLAFMCRQCHTDALTEETINASKRVLVLKDFMPLAPEAAVKQSSQLPCHS